MSACNAGDLGSIPWRRERLPIPVLWPREFHGLYGSWGSQNLDTTEQLSLHFTSPRSRWTLLNCIIDLFSGASQDRTYSILKLFDWLVPSLTWHLVGTLHHFIINYQMWLILSFTVTLAGFTPCVLNRVISSFIVYLIFCLIGFTSFVHFQIWHISLLTHMYVNQFTE